MRFKLNIVYSYRIIFPHDIAHFVFHSMKNSTWYQSPLADSRPTRQDCGSIQCACRLQRSLSGGPKFHQDTVDGIAKSTVDGWNPRKHGWTIYQLVFSDFVSIQSRTENPPKVVNSCQFLWLFNLSVAKNMGILWMLHQVQGWRPMVFLRVVQKRHIDHEECFWSHVPLNKNMIISFKML